MNLHKEGRSIIPLFLIIVSVLVMLTWIYIPMVELKIIILTGLAVLFFMVLRFFRIPKRPVIQNDNIIYAPADGKIVVIEETFEPEYFKDERIQISVFMSVHNVHSNRFPISGEVTYAKYHKGKFLLAKHPKSSTENERTSIVLKMANGQEILIRQIAGVMARRICAYTNPGDNVTQGDELGFIKFGSRVDVFLPKDANVVCSVGEISRYNITPLAQIDNQVEKTK